MPRDPPISAILQSRLKDLEGVKARLRFRRPKSKKRPSHGHGSKSGSKPQDRWSSVGLDIPNKTQQPCWGCLGKYSQEKDFYDVWVEKEHGAYLDCFELEIHRQIRKPVLEWGSEREAGQLAPYFWKPTASWGIQLNSTPKILESYTKGGSEFSRHIYTSTSRALVNLGSTWSVVGSTLHRSTLKKKHVFPPTTRIL